MKQLLLIALLVLSYSSYAQGWEFEKPNYKSIEKNIKDKESNLYYESLMNRFQQADSTFTLKEKRHLYYGYSFNKNYSPYSRSDYSDSLRSVLKKEKLDSLDLNHVIKFSNKMLLDNPFDLNAINYQLYALEQLGNKNIFNKRIVQIKAVFDALMSSGNGKSKKEAFYVIYTSHEYDLLNILGLKFGGTQRLIDHYDYLTLDENKTDLKGLFFDVSPCLNSMSKLLKD